MLSFEKAALTGTRDGFPVFVDDDEGFAGTKLTCDDEEAGVEVVAAIAHL